MAITDGFQVPGFGVVTLLAVLVGLGILYIVVSYRFDKMQKSQRMDPENIKKESGIPLKQEDAGLSTGQLKLIGVDEKTAAMIMAIVSHESGIPLSELQFISIKALDES